MKRLIEAGVPPEQAEAQAEVLAEAFVHNIDSLVTRDYLDARLDASEARLKGRINLLLWMVGIGFSVLILPKLTALLSS